MNDWSIEETDEPFVADHRNFYKVEKWSKDGQRVERMLFAGNSLDRTREFLMPRLGAPAPRALYDSPAFACA